MPVGRDVADAGFRDLADWLVGQVLAVDDDLAAFNMAQASDGFDQFVLAVAVDPGQTKDFPAADSEGETLDCFGPPVFVDVQVLDFQDIFAQIEGSLVQLKVNMVANHHFGQLFVVCIGNADGLDRLTSPDDSDPVGTFLDFLQLVSDQDDGLAFLGQVLHDLDEFSDFLRRQNGSWFVEDQDVGPAVKDLQDFNSLLLSDGDVGNLSVRVDGQAVLLGQGQDLFSGGLEVQGQALGGFMA